MTVSGRGPPGGIGVDAALECKYRGADRGNRAHL